MVQTKPVAPGERTQQIALAVIAAAGLLVAGRFLMRRPADATTLLVAPTPGYLTIHVAGEVVVPGVYHLRPEARWADAVDAARGATIAADLHAVNLAQRVRDGDRVLIPRLPDPPAPVGGIGDGSPAHGAVARPENGRQAPRGPARDAGDTVRPVDLNAASTAELEALPGIGPVLAGRIVEYRTMHGRFERVEDLQEVEGVGPRLLERLRRLVQVR